MKKYIQLLQVNINVALTYRFELFASWIYRLLNLLTFFFLWKLTTNDSAEIARLLQYFVVYYFFVKPFDSSKLASWMGKAINSGEVNNYLVKPVSFPLVMIFQLIPRLLTRIAMPVIVFVLLNILYPSTFAPHSVESLLFFIIFVVLGIVLWNCIMLLFGCIPFWGTEIAFTLTVLDLLINVFKGMYIPAYLFPESLTNILELTPIPYFGYYSVGIYQDGVESVDLLQGFTVVCIWIAVFLFLFNFTYRKGLAAYDALGG